MALGDTYVDLKWDAAQDNVSVVGYQLFNGAGALILDVGNTLTYRVTGLSPSTTYTYKLKAYDGASPPNVSAFGNTLTVTTLSSDSAGPAKMTINSIT